MNVSVLTFSPPDELIFEIFSRLPSRAVARCRCLSKFWFSMLRHQDFIDSFWTKSCARARILFAYQDDSKFIFFSSPQPENPEDNSYVVAANRLACFPRSYGFFGCTSGFLGYGAKRISDVTESWKNAVYVPVICNPNTGQSLTLPRLKSRKRFALGSYLGYEPISKQLKVLSMEISLVSVKHKVLTLGTQKKLSWRLVECSIPHSPSRKWICISGALYYAASVNSYSFISMIVCFDLRTEKFTVIDFMETFNRALPCSTNMVNYNGKLGLLMSGDSHDVSRASTCFELWVLQDAAKHEWSKYVYALPPSWKDLASGTMRIAGMVGVNEVVLTPWFQNVPFCVIYFNVERKTITKVGIQGMEAFQGKRFTTYLNYVENIVELLEAF